MNNDDTNKTKKGSAGGDSMHGVVICNWSIPEGYDDIYFTSCGHNMMFDHKSPIELGFKVCPWCAKKLNI